MKTAGQSPARVSKTGGHLYNHRWAHSIRHGIYTKSLLGQICNHLGIKKMWYIYTVEYYSAIKKNAITPFAATWMDLEIIILREVRKRKTNIISKI